MQIDKETDKGMMESDEEWRGSEWKEEKRRDQSSVRKTLDGNRALGIELTVLETESFLHSVWLWRSEHRELDAFPSFFLPGIILSLPWPGQVVLGEVLGWRDRRSYEQLWQHSWRNSPRPQCGGSYCFTIKQELWLQYYFYNHKKPHKTYMYNVWEN